MTHSFPYKWEKVIYGSRKAEDGGAEGEPAGKEEQEFVERKKLEVCGRTAYNSSSSGIELFLLCSWIGLTCTLTC